MWSDRETNIDYLNFGYLVDLLVEIAMNRDLTPSTIGLYGDWGSGKSSLMKLALAKIEEFSKNKQNINEAPKTLCIEFNGWLFEGYEDTKTSLCGTILDTLANDKRFGPRVRTKAKNLIKNIDFKKLIGKGVKYGVDVLFNGVGTLADILSSILKNLKDQAEKLDTKQIEKVLAQLKKEETVRKEIQTFRSDFQQLLKDSKVENVVVFIDELDRCSPDTILDVFEAMRLFLFVDGMSFVIGADERLIQYAIKTKYKEVPGNNLDIGKEYLEKVIQYPINVPQLNSAEVNQYLSCLLLESSLSGDEFKIFLDVIHNMKPDEELTMQMLEKKAESIAEKCKSDIALAKQISSVLAPSINGNPRQCKRFLNTLTMRISLAKARGITLDKNILAKLMLAEYFESEFFKMLIDSKNRETFKIFESEEELQDDNPFSKWKKDEWVKRWMKNGPSLADKRLDEYVYFANVKNRYGQSNLEQLSPNAQKCYEYLLDGTQTNRNRAIKMVKDLDYNERNIIASEVFNVVEISSPINVEVLRSYVDFCAEADMNEDAINKLMQIPATTYTPTIYAQLSSFIAKLPPKDATRFKTYLGENPKLKNTIERLQDVNQIFINKK